METIVVGYDGSEHADRALDRAVELAENGKLVVVSAAHPTLVAVHGSSGGVDPVEREQVASSLSAAKARLAGSRTSVEFIEGHGDPADVLVREAESAGANVIVVGARGRNALERAVLGSVSTNVVHHAKCDVLVVR